MHSKFISSVEEKMTYTMWRSEYIYVWWAKWMIVSREKRNMATLTSQFKIEHDLEGGEFMQVVYANFSKWMYKPSMKTPCARETARHFLLVEISSVSVVLSLVRLLWNWILGSVSHFNTHTQLHSLSLSLSVIHFKFYIKRTDKKSFQLLYIYIYIYSLIVLIVTNNT